jgi:16S rRNA (guanine(966)-N(2))-methyltransferase RsmD
MRIIGGSAKGAVIRTLKGDCVRPTADKVREALFDILFGRVEGAVFLDLYAGSGAVGIEALSRGAEKVIFVEKDKKVVSIMKENINKCKFVDRAVIINRKVESAFGEIKKYRDAFDLIFMDPPYGEADYGKILYEMCGHGLLEKDGTLAIEHMKKEDLPEEIAGIRRIKTRTYGQTTLSFYKF